MNFEFKIKHENVSIDTMSTEELLVYQHNLILQTNKLTELKHNTTDPCIMCKEEFIKLNQDSMNLIIETVLLYNKITLSKISKQIIANMYN